MSYRSSGSSLSAAALVAFLAAGSNAYAQTPAVSRASPQVVQLVQGGEAATVILTGSLLGQIAQIGVVALGRRVPGVGVMVVRRGSRQTTVKVQAGASARPGTGYTLVLITVNQQLVTVHRSVLDIEVVSPEPTCPR